MSSCDGVVVVGGRALLLAASMLSLLREITPDDMIVTP